MDGKDRNRKTAQEIRDRELSRFNKSFQIADRWVGGTAPCFIIAEIGSNHNGDIENAYRLIETAKNAGADAVKFQSFRADTLYSRYTPPRKNPDGTEGRLPYELLKENEMPYEWHKKLKNFCDDQKIIFMSSPFDFEAIESLESVNAQVYKIASSEIGDPRLLKRIAKTQKPTILSTGKATIEEIERAVLWMESENCQELCLLHCVASYPADYAAMNLRAIPTLENKFDCIVGLSDHNTENLTAVAAVALGAKVVEKHITLSREMEGPDHHFALEPSGLYELVDWIRKTELSMGSGEKLPHASEQQGRRLGNRSLHIRKDLQIGDRITEEDIIIKRPALGIEPFKLNQVIGKALKKEIKEDEWLTWDHLED